MSTQTQTPADLAVKFLEKYATVIGTLDAIERKDREFLLKYATVVGSPAAIDLVAPETDPVSVVSEDETPEVPTDPITPPTEPEEPTEPTDPAGVGEGTDEQGD